MTLIFSFQTHRTARLVARLLVSFALTTVARFSVAADFDQSRLAPPPGDGWQLLSALTARPAPMQVAMANPAPAPIAAATTSKSLPGPPAPVALPERHSRPQRRVRRTWRRPWSSSGATAAPGGVSTLTITPQDINLRNALDRWLQQQGWQLAWKIDDDLPLEFNASFSGDFKSVLTQVMQATNHMRTPTRVCKHTNSVIRVVARAANCQE